MLTGLMARRQITARPDSQKGARLVLAGIGLGLLGFLFLLYAAFEILRVAIPVFTSD